MKMFDAKWFLSVSVLFAIFAVVSAVVGNMDVAEDQGIYALAFLALAGAIHLLDLIVDKRGEQP